MDRSYHSRSPWVWVVGRGEGLRLQEGEKWGRWEAQDHSRSVHLLSFWVMRERLTIEQTEFLREKTVPGRFIFWDTQKLYTIKLVHKWSFQKRFNCHFPLIVSVLGLPGWYFHTGTLCAIKFYWNTGRDHANGFSDQDTDQLLQLRSRKSLPYFLSGKVQETTADPCVGDGKRKESRKVAASTPSTNWKVTWEGEEGREGSEHWALNGKLCRWVHRSHQRWSWVAVLNKQGARWLLCLPWRMQKTCQAQWGFL